MMKISRFTIVIPEAKNNFLLACTVTKAVARFTADSFEDLKRGDRENLSELTEKEFDTCVEMGFLVPKELNEGNFLFYWLTKDRLNPEILSVYVSFSTKCDFDCIYCCEKGQVLERTMDQESIFSLLYWLESKLDNGNFKTILIYLYGGEPLLQKEMISFFLPKVKELTEKREIVLKLGLVTNGFLLSHDFVEFLSNFGLSDIHLTIDGPEGVHNSRRPLKKEGEKGSFSKIIENLKSILDFSDSININCGISFDRSNIEEIPELLDFLKEEKISDFIKIYFRPISQTLGQFSNPDSFCSLFSLSDGEIADGLIFLYSEAKKRSFPISSFFSLGPCMIIAEGACVIAPDGKIYKCLNMIDCEKLSIEDVKEEKSSPIFYDFMVAKQLQWCLFNTSCPFVPVCSGGCLMESFVKNGNISEVICHREMMEKIYRVLIPLCFNS
ncbi:MAG: radical SAM protein [Candidatus Paceibacterota bacterium]